VIDEKGYESVTLRGPARVTKPWATCAKTKNQRLQARRLTMTDTNSGIFIRAADPTKIGADNSYEVNIWDIRPDPSYGTETIVNFAKVAVPLVHKAGGQWNTMEVTAQDASMTVKLNGVVTSTLQDSKFSSGPLALQFGPGVKNALGGPIKWRKVMIKSL
jgi:hypothetical protein